LTGTELYEPHRSSAKVCKTVALITWGVMTWSALLKGVVWYPAAIVLLAVSLLFGAATYFLAKWPTVERHSGLVLVMGSLLIGALGIWTMRMADHPRYGGSHLLSSLIVASVFLAGGIVVFFRSRRAPKKRNADSDSKAPR
jgi:hypothetical protein